MILLFALFALKPLLLDSAFAALIPAVSSLSMLGFVLARLPNLHLHPGYPTAPYRHEFRATPTLYVQGSPYAIAASINARAASIRSR